MATVPISTAGKADGPPASGDPASRADGSSGDAKAERLRQSLPTFDWTIARVMAVLAAGMVPGGLVVIGLGWYGAAHTPFVFEQVPYLISGGLLGVGLLTCGGLLYVGSWLARMAEQQRDEGEKIRHLVAGVRHDLSTLPGAVAGGAALATQQAFVATQTGTMFHRPECSVVSGRSDLRRVSADEGLAPCKICQPLAEAD